MAALHPHIVHFVIVLTIVGVAFRLVSLLGRPAFTSPAAATLLILAAIAGAFAVESGEAAHGPVERMPGVRPAVEAHETWGGRAHNVLLAIGVIELVGLAMFRSRKVRVVHITSAVVGVVAAFCVYQAADRGGTLVYSYAGGPGIRTGDPEDVDRLFLGGLYQQALQDRAAGNASQAAELMSLAASRFPNDTEVRLLAAESLLLDRKDAQGALTILAAIDVPQDNRVQRTRRATLQADAFEAAGQKDGAIAVLQAIVEAYPTNARLRQRLDELKGSAAAAK